MKSFEHISTQRTIRIGSALLLSGLALAGCANSKSDANNGPSSTAETATSDNDFRIEREFTPSGKMITQVLINNGSKDIAIDATYSYCDGKDLVEVSYWYDADNRQRSVNHPACADGKLSEQDFSNTN